MSLLSSTRFIRTTSRLWNGIDEYEYSVDFSAKQKIEREDEDKETEANYRIKAKVNPDGKITELNMVKVIK